MKKLLMLGAVAMLFTVTGCKDARADISNPDKAILTIGKEKITNDDVYNFTKKTYGSSVALSLIMDKIADQENIKITDAMKKDADAQVASAKESYGDSFSTQLKTFGYKNEEDFKKGEIYPALRQTELVKKYVASKETSMFDTYHPVKAEVFESDNADKANTALEAIKGGMSIADAVAAHGVNTTYKGAEAVYTTKSGLPAGVFDKIKESKDKGLIEAVIEDSTTSKYYIVNLTNVDAKTFKDAAIAEIAAKGSTELQTVCTAFYLKKYDFKVYDKDIYDGVKTANEDYIVQ